MHFDWFNNILLVLDHDLNWKRCSWRFPRLFNLVFSASVILSTYLKVLTFWSFYTTASLLSTKMSQNQSTYLSERHFQSFPFAGDILVANTLVSVTEETTYRTQGIISGLVHMSKSLAMTKFSWTWSKALLKSVSTNLHTLLGLSACSYISSGSLTRFSCCLVDLY